MDLSMYGVSAAQLQAMPANLFPLLDLCHFLLCAISVRQELGVPFSRTNPLATWVATLTASFAGSMVANPLLGKPILAAISDEYMLFLATVVWWSVFYSPGDLVYTVAKNQVVYVPMCVLKEVYRAKKVMGGIGDARKVFPDHEVISIAIGLIKGNGSGFIKPITRLVAGQWKPTSTELLKMSVTSKECLVAAALLVADSQGHIPRPLAGDLLYVTIVAVFILVKLTHLLAEPIDPFQPLDRGVELLTGGLWDGGHAYRTVQKED